MSWTRLDDNWADTLRTMDLDFQTRWHYLSLIQFCSRTGKRDGRLKAVDARSCSDVDDPIGCLNELIEHNLVTRDVTRDGNRDVTHYVLVHIKDHLPSDNKVAQRERTARHRAHKAGDHSKCLPEHCSEAPVTGVTRDIARDTGTVTGQDRALEEEGYQKEEESITGATITLPPEPRTWTGGDGWDDLCDECQHPLTDCLCIGVGRG